MSTRQTRKRAKVARSFRLPDDLRKHVFSFLPHHMMFKLKSVCRNWSGGQLLPTLNISLHFTHNHEFQKVVQSCNPITVRAVDVYYSRQLEDASLECLPTFSNILSLNLSRCRKIGAATAMFVSELKTLTKLNVSFCPMVNDASLESFSALQCLTSLDLTGCSKFSNQGLAHVGKLGNLTSLALSECDQIKAEGIAHLSELQLRSFSMRFGEITDVEMEQVCRISSLTYLDVSKNQGITDAGLQHLIPSVITINLSGCEVTDEGLMFLSAHTKEIHMEDCMGVVGTWVNAVPLPKLQSLHLADSGAFCPVDFSSFTSLSELDMSWCHRVTDDMIVALSSCSCLTSLNVVGCKLLTDASVEAVATITSLRHVALSGHKLTDQGMAFLAKCTWLVRLRIFHILQVTDAGIKHLVPLQSLTFLSLSYAKALTANGFASIAKLANLRELVLTNSGLTDDGLHALLALTELRTLDLSGSINFTNDGLLAVKRFRALQTFAMGFCSQITDEGTRNLSTSTNLIHIRCEGSYRITKSGLARLARMPYLESLERSFYPKYGTRECIRGNNVGGYVRL